MEQTSDLVYLGKTIHQESYKREIRELNIDNRIKIDFLRKTLEIHEIKKSRKLRKAHFYQILYYIYYLKQKGILVKGVINYPLSKRIEGVELTSKSEKEIKEILKKMKKILDLKIPPIPKFRSYCKKCSYYHLCFT